MANQMSDLADEFNSHLSNSISQLTKFRSELVTELEETQRTLTKNLQNTFDEVHSKSFERITGSLNNFQSAMEGVSKEIGQFSSDLKGLEFGSIGEAAPELGTKMVQLTTDLTSIQSNLEPIIMSFENVDSFCMSVSPYGSWISRRNGYATGTSRPGLLHVGSIELAG